MPRTTSRRLNVEQRWVKPSGPSSVAANVSRSMPAAALRPAASPADQPRASARSRHSSKSRIGSTPRTFLRRVANAAASAARGPKVPRWAIAAYSGAASVQSPPCRHRVLETNCAGEGEVQPAGAPTPSQPAGDAGHDQQLAKLASDAVLREASHRARTTRLGLRRLPTVGDRIARCRRVLAWKASTGGAISFVEPHGQFDAVAGTQLVHEAREVRLRGA